MSLSSWRSRVQGAIIALLIAGWLPYARAAVPSTTLLGDSIRPVASAPVTGAGNARTALKPSETAATMTVEVALKMRNLAEFQARVAGGEHVPLPELAAKYEPLPANYQAVADWLTTKGLTVTNQDSHHLAVFARGTVSQIQSAMQVTFARVSSEGKEYTSATTAPSVPSSLAPLLIGVNGLQPHHHAHKHIAKPNLQIGSASYTPTQIAQAYQASGLYGAGITGAGQTIAIVIDAFPSTSDLTAFWNNNPIDGIKQSVSNVQFINVTGTDAVSGEETLDTEWSGAIAPQAKIRVYSAEGLTDANLDACYARVLSDAASNSIHQMSMSFGEGETDYETDRAQINTDNNLFLELTNAGVTCFASTGDGGSTPGVDGQGNLTETGSLQAEFPSSDPYVTGVGGTTLILDANNNENAEVAWNNGIGATGGGSSIFFTRPTWQTGKGVPSGSQRLVPDISCAGDPNYGADYWFQGSESTIGGTSWSSPTCAGFCALINQARANAGLPVLGQLGPRIYPLLGTTSFRDIVGGGNETGNSPNQFAATTGYDETTGVGSPLLQPLIQALTGGQTLVAQPANVTVNLGATAIYTVTASGSPVGFQWQRMPAGSTSWANIVPGSVYSISIAGNASTLTITNTTAVMSGDQFQCVVTYAGAVTLTSNPASTLTVETPWIISTYAGTGIAGLTGNTPLASAEFYYPSGIAIDSSGDFYIADLDNNVIREITPAGAVSTPYGSTTGVSGNQVGIRNSARFNAPRDIAIDSSNNIYVSDEGNNVVRIITPGNGFVNTLSTGAATLSEPKGLCVDSSGNLYIADSGNNVIRKIVISNGSTVSSTILAGSTGQAGAGYRDSADGSPLFNEPIGLAVDNSNGPNAGCIYVTEYINQVIRKITPTGVVTTLAGQAGISGCVDGAGTQALFNVPRGIAVDGAGNIYVTDSSAPAITQTQPLFTGNNVLRKITPDGVVTTLAGQAGIAGKTDGNGSAAQFYNPCGLAMGSNGGIYFTDASNNTIRAATPQPAVSITATQPNASVQGFATGQFTVTRAGSTAASLTVDYSTSGTAVNGTDYATLPGTVTIPAGATSATITVTPLPDSQASSSLTVQLTLTGPLANVTIGANATATVTIAELLQSQLVSFASWEGTFPAFTPQNDGIPTLLKYLDNINPSVAMSTADRAALPSPGTTTIGGTQYLTLTYREYLDATGITVNVQTSTDLQTWTTVNPPDLSQLVGIDSNTGDPILKVGVAIAPGATPQFIRLNVTQP